MKEAWDFYFSLYSKETIGLGISAFIATLSALTFFISFVIRPLYYILFQKRNFYAERTLVKFAKQIEKNKNKTKYIGINDISELLNIPHDEARIIITRSPKFRKIHSVQELWVRRKVYTPEDDDSYGEKEFKSPDLPPTSTNSYKL